MFRKPGTTFAAEVSSPVRRWDEIQTRGEDVMFYWAAVFLVIGLVALLFGFGGIAGMSMNIAWILFIVGLVIAVVFMFIGRRPRI
jgi:uncharacterized membrane protein YtjA (UPF0391 family)